MKKYLIIFGILFFCVTHQAQEPIKINYQGTTLYVYPEDLPGMNEDAITWYSWHNMGLEMANAISLTDGRSNTQAIVNAYGEYGAAATLCNNLNAYGHNDWYLPSIEELKAIYNHRDKIGNLSSIYYWSSTEIEQWTAWIIDFETGEKAAYNKTSGMTIRPVRRD